VSITERSGNLRKDLKNNILESVSTLKVFSQLIIQLQNVNEEQKKLKEEVKNATKDLARRRDSQPVRQVAPPLDHFQQYPRAGARQMLPFEGERRKFYSEMVKNEENKTYKLTLKVKDDTLTPEQIKLQPRKNANPTDIKVGITAIKATKDKGILIETGSEEEINSLSLEINSKFGEQLEIIKHKLRKPRIIIYNVSEEITTENVAAIIKAQNPEF
jgi:hypothetical protein